MRHWNSKQFLFYNHLALLEYKVPASYRIANNILVTSANVLHICLENSQSY